MGFTLASALGLSQSDARICVVELIPDIVSWNRHHLGNLAGNPLKDPRTATEVADIATVIRKKKAAWDAILLDVDNGRQG